MHFEGSTAHRKLAVGAVARGYVTELRTEGFGCLLDVWDIAEIDSTTSRFSRYASKRYPGILRKFPYVSPQMLLRHNMRGN